MPCTTGWRPADEPPRYTLNASFWNSIGLRRLASPDVYRCPELQPYRWQHCRRQPTGSACEQIARLGPVRQIVFVGDSTMSQIFIAFVLLLGGTFGVNRARAYTMFDVTAIACGSIRLWFVRSDLLLYTEQMDQDATEAFKCGSMSTNEIFVQRLAQADVAILGVGHHMPRIVDLVGVRAGWRFLEQNLNHTLASALAARTRERGASRLSAQQKSLLLVGATQPVANCSRFTAPLSAEEAAAALHIHVAEEDPADSESSGAATPPSRMPSHYPAGIQAESYERYWRMMPRLNALARSVADSLGVSWMSLAAMSAMRPDGVMARHMRNADCVHSCMPGPVDGYAHELLEHVERLLIPHHPHHAATPTSVADHVDDSAAAAMSPGPAKEAPPAWFAPNSSGVLLLNDSEWLEGGPVVGNHANRIHPAALIEHPRRGQPREALGDREWWPFKACANPNRTRA